MRPVNCFVSLIGALCFLTSCSTGSEKYYLVQNPTPRVSSLGFYISPPPGKNWYEKHLEESLYYFKNTRGEHYALTTQATEIVFPSKTHSKQEILQYIKDNKQKNLSQRQLHSVAFQHSFVEIKNSICVRYDISYDDYGTDKKGKHPYLRIFNRGMVCKHPKTPHVGIDISYMEKYLPDVDFRPSLRDEGEIFLSSLNFYDSSQKRH